MTVHAAGECPYLKYVEAIKSGDEVKLWAEAVDGGDGCVCVCWICM